MRHGKFPASIAVMPVFLLVTLAGCGNGGGGSDGGLPADAGDGGVPSIVTLKGGDYSLVVNAETMEMALSGPKGALVTIPADGIRIGNLAKISDEANYDPYPMMLGEVDWPAGLKWLSPSKMTINSATATAAGIGVEFGSRKASLDISVTSAGSFALSFVPGDTTANAPYIRIKVKADKDEGLYGLGAYLDDVNNRGKIRSMQMEVGPGESSNNEAHYPIPFVIGTEGWGWFTELYRPGAYDVAKTDPEMVDAYFATAPDTPKGIKFHLFAAAHPLDVTKLYYDVTGYPILPARWALGPLFWRDENKDQAEVISDINIMRDKDLPDSAIWIDRPYATSVNTFDFNKTQFPDPAAMIAAIHELGYRLALWSTPYLDKYCGELLSYPESHSYFPPVTGILLNKWGKPIDFTNADAYAWWQSLIERYTGIGIEGFKLDYGEDVAVGVVGARNVWKFSNGQDERTMHLGYKTLYHKVYAEKLPKNGGFLLSRAGGWGDQKYISVVWPGDLDADFSTYGEEVTFKGETWIAVGGLPASIIYGLSVGVSGFPFYGADTGGYRHSESMENKEIKTRWFEQTALSTVMQIGDSSSVAPWEFDKGFNYDQEMLDWYRIYTRLHLRLFPYEWTYAQNIKNNGRAISRPLGLAYPELGVHPNDIYMFGDSLLVAPVVKKGAVTKDVIFPPGRWANWFSGTVYDGGKTATVDAPLGALPLYIAEGGIVPLLRPTIQTMSPTTKPERVDSYATTPGVLYPVIFAGAKSEFALFDGSVVGQEKKGTGADLSYRDGSEFKYGAVFQLVAWGSNAPASVKSNGSSLSMAATLKDLESAASGWFLDVSGGGTLYIKAPAGEQAVEVR